MTAAGTRVAPPGLGPPGSARTPAEPRRVLALRVHPEPASGYRGFHREAKLGRKLPYEVVTHLLARVVATEHHRGANVGSERLGQRRKGKAGQHGCLSSGPADQL